MDVSIEVPEVGITANHAEIIDNHTDIPNMLLTIDVGLFSEKGDLLKTLEVNHTLIGFPIPSPDEQWEIVKPTLDAMQIKASL